MVRALGRWLFLALLVVAVVGLLRRRSAAPAPAVTPLRPADNVRPRWVAPVDGVPPAGYPLKANESSHIFHAPGGRFYDRTRADRCYADPADAIADGYRAAKA